MYTHLKHVIMLIVSSPHYCFIFTKRLFYVNRDDCITKSSPVTTVPPTQSGVGTVSPTSLMPSLMSETASPIVTSPLDEEDDTGWPTMSPTRDIVSSNVDVSDNESCLRFIVFELLFLFIVLPSFPC